MTALLNAAGIHYRAGGACQAAYIIKETDPGNTNVVTIETHVPGVLGAIITAQHADIDHGDPWDTDGTWHYGSEDGT
jgi:hypothetical protein